MCWGDAGWGESSISMVEPVRIRKGPKPTRRLATHADVEIPVALGCPVVRENLPRPYVCYPEHYGAFFAFKSSATDPSPVFCLCNRAAVENAVQLEMLNHDRLDAFHNRKTHFDIHLFPDALRQDVIEFAKNGRALPFEIGLCHRCNLATPSLRYCVEMYGGLFKQRYGWYVNQAYFRIGLRKGLGGEVLSHLCPDDILVLNRETCDLQAQSNGLADLLGMDYETLRPKFQLDDRERRELDERLDGINKRIQKLQRMVGKYVENIVRAEFEFLPIGEGWVAETILFKLVQVLYPGEEILRHHRPEWLSGLELDIFLPGRALAFEYQGQQHFNAVDAWGGETALLELQERDERKRQICAGHAIRLVEISYYEPLSLEHVRDCVSEPGCQSD